MKTPTDLALAALNGFKWLGNNLHNIRSMPDQFESFYKAALDDAEKAIAALSLAPDPIAPGHNPDQLTVSQVGDGWRLLDEDEIHDRHRLFVEIQQWLPPKWDDTGFIGNYKPAIYRTRLTREELAALDKPKPAWQLPAPPAGQRWHREDFTEADLPDGWRPLLEGETRQIGDEILSYREFSMSRENLEWLSFGQEWKHEESDTECTPGSSKTRTTRPLPSTPVMVPWTFEDAPMVFRVKDKADGSLYRAEIYPEHVGIFHSYAPQAFRAISYQYLLDNFVQLDGSPCGIVK